MAIVEDEKRWVAFKYERLLNFCYKCGLLSYDLKECLDCVGSKKPPEQTEL